MLVKEYCWEGNRAVDFVVQENTVRQEFVSWMSRSLEAYDTFQVRPWFHAPWMHASANGREPLKGLTFERSIPQYEFASSQKSALQNWAIGFYNAPGTLGSLAVPNSQNCHITFLQFVLRGIRLW